MWINKLVRPEILALKPYSSARTEYNGEQAIRLDANENPYLAYGQNTLTLNRYPEPQPENLRNRLAQIYEVCPEQLLLTRGMDEGIDLLLRTFCRPLSDSLIITPPTFGYYEVAAAINGVSVTKIPLTGQFEPDWEALSKATGCKLIFLCSPNNPTGNVIALEKIEALCRTYGESTLVVVDEAYIEFAATQSAVALLATCKNLIVMRTLSKAYGLAGARIGCVIAAPEIIVLLKKIIPPYPLPTPAIDAALKSLSPVGLAYTAKQIARIRQQRQLLSDKLSALPDLIAVYPSAANFILIKVRDADKLYARLRRQGIIIRNRGQDIPDTLRITIGTEEENKVLLSALGLSTLPDKFNRQCTRFRKTEETEIMVVISQDCLGEAEIDTGINFFNHMLEQVARHSGLSMAIAVQGDLHVDAHHTIEDVAIVLGEAIRQMLGEKLGINRYGFVLPMDEAQAIVSLDLGGRGCCVFNADFSVTQLGDMPLEMVKHFFNTLAENMKAAIHISASGDNNHHLVESIYKGFARALRQAITEEGRELASTKGVL
ncbi:histidinol-phosphate transaminase [Legionella dresdenensis]|uniref:Multifunctional fusion protein n=1 Tax=Legionella dresdenensis TaxID=450200 RepID=A0ABV8CBZ5_9GAMM